MTGQEFIELLLEQYSTTFDITNDYSIDGYTYQALGEFRVASSRFVLVKQAQLWSANSYEYILFDLTDKPDTEHVRMLERHILKHVEPILVRKGEKCPAPQHMYSFMTIIMVSSAPIEKDAEKALKKMNFYKNYRFAIRGYSLLRVVGIDLTRDRVIVNAQAKQLKKEFDKLLKGSDKFTVCTEDAVSASPM